jgi:hypothetical protein
MTERLVRLLKVKPEPGEAAREKGKETQVISDRTATKRLEA